MSENLRLSPEFGGPKINKNKLFRICMSVMIGVGAVKATLVEAGSASNDNQDTSAQIDSEDVEDETFYVRVSPGVRRVPLYRDLNNRRIASGFLTEAGGPLRVTGRDPSNPSLVRVRHNGLDLWLDLQEGAEVYEQGEAEGENFEAEEISLRPNNEYVIENVSSRYTLTFTVESRALHSGLLEIVLPNWIKLQFYEDRVDFHRLDEDERWQFLSTVSRYPSRTMSGEVTFEIKVLENQTQIRQDDQLMGFVTSTAESGDITLSLEDGRSLTMTGVLVVSE